MIVLKDDDAVGQAIRPTDAHWPVAASATGGVDAAVDSVAINTQLTS